MSRLYLLGGRQKDFFFRREKEWNLYDTALILEVDTESGVVRTCVEHKTPAEAGAGENPSSQFKSGTRVGSNLYACTNTEVLIYRVPDFERLDYVSLPCFNDLHHVMPAQDTGTLLAASTGLDMVVRFTPQGQVLEEWDTLQEPIWTRFSREVDYRKIATTKPHRSHPNFVFELDRQLWVTRFNQRDALCLSDPGKRIEIGIEAPHDGIVTGGRIYFTVVDGRLVVVDSTTRKVERIVDLKTMEGSRPVLGWCRGVLPISKELLWVGFTRVRKTRWDQNVLWLRGKEGFTAGPTHIALYDISRDRCLQQIELERHGLGVIFSILPAE